MIRGGKRQIFLVKYERLRDWCAFCGMIGHLSTEHGDGVHPPSPLVSRDLKASLSMRSGGCGRGRGRGFCPGGGYGRGAREDILEDFDDLANVNDVTDPEAEPMETELSTERLIGGGGMPSPGEELVVTNPSGQGVGKLVNQFQKRKASDQVPLALLQRGNKKELKRWKRAVWTKTYLI
jgi:hypothetical protein